MLDDTVMELETFILSPTLHAISPSFPVYDDNSIFTDHVNKFSSEGAFVTALQHKDELLRASLAVGMLRAGEAVGELDSLLPEGISLGTAFYVSPTILCTARHNLFVKSDSVRAKGDLLFTTKCNFLNSKPDKIVVQLDYDEAIRKKVDDDLADKDPFKGGGMSRLIDFVFLRSSVESKHYLLPQANLPPYVTTLGYPGETKHTPETTRFGFPIYEAFHGQFYHKHASPGGIISSNGRVLAHSCSTNPGVSGGPVVDPTTCRFVGVHTIGPVSMEHNLAYSVQHPVFKKLYRALVYPELSDEDKSLVQVYILS